MRVCKLCGSPLPPYRTRPYQDCPQCEERILQIAIRMHRPAVYDDFLELRPQGTGSGRWEHVIQQVLERNGYERHVYTHARDWPCDFATRWAPEVRGKRTHFHRRSEIQ